MTKQQKYNIKMWVKDPTNWIFIITVILSCIAYFDAISWKFESQCVDEPRVQIHGTSYCSHHHRFEKYRKYDLNKILAEEKEETIRSRAISLHFLRFSGVHPPGQRSAFSWC